MNFIASFWTLTAALRNEYLSLFNTAQIKAAAIPKAEAAYQKLLANRSRYEAVANAFGYKGIPWYLVGILHMRESSFDFSKHLHNGDSLARRTINVPAGRPLAIPAAGVGKPYTWEESAIDAIRMKIQDDPAWRNNRSDDSVESLLNKMETYNGGGYRAKGLPSAYVWSDSTVQQPGKFTSDGRFSAVTVDSQLGAGTLLKYFLEKEAKKK